MAYFIPTEEVRRLTRGSYEHLVARLEGILQEKADTLFEEKGCSAKLLGTFSGYALASSDSGKCLRIKYEESDKGRLHIVGSEPVEVKTVSEDDLHGFLRSESERVLRLYDRGSVTEAVTRLKGLVRQVGGWTPPDKEETVVESVLASLDRSRPWWGLYNERKDHILTYLGEDAGSSVTLRPKFFKLYDGSMADKDLERYRDLVAEDLLVLQGKIQKLFVQVESARATLADLPLTEDDTARTFSAFAEDLLEDLDRVARAASELPKQVRRVDSLGRLHDRLTTRLHDMGIASEFVSQMANRLGEAQ